MKNIYLVLLSISFFACNDGSNGSEANDTSSRSSATPRGESPAEPIAETPIVKGCYMQVLKRDTMVAQLEQEGNRIRGKLTFDNFEKDGSSGKVEGVVEDGIVKLLYSFTSEGMNSVMDVHFKPSGDSLIRGIGTMRTRNDTAYFQDPGAVEFVGSALKKMPCVAVPAKYRM